MAFSDKFHNTAKAVSDSFSINSNLGVTSSSSLTGGLHEYYSLSNIIFDTTGTQPGNEVNNSNNFIPLIYSLGGTTQTQIPCGRNPPGPDGNCYSTITTPSLLQLGSDLISSGRLKLGMVVYVISKSQSYQFMIDNYESLYNAAESNISETDQLAQVLGGTTESDALIDAWVNHKVEGELKNPSDSSQGTWSPDEANWKKYPNVPEYFTINAVPASEEVDDFNFEDAYIVVPQEWNGKKVVSVEASLFTMDSSNFETDAGIQLLQTSKHGDQTGYTYAHTFGQKSHSSNFANVLPLSGNSTLQLKIHGSFGSGNQGYTATFKVIS